MRIEALKDYEQRHLKGSYFLDLPPHLRDFARHHLRCLSERRQGHLPPWRFAILVGRAKFLAIRKPDSQWGRSMLAKRGGYAVQSQYRLEGGSPTAKATAVRLAR
jgi:hypothetical protein